jgi:penicillin-binding protein 2
MRLKIVRVIIIILFLMLAAGLVHTQVFRGNYFYSLSVNNRIRVVSLEGQRGRIFDREGRVIADSRLAFDVTVLPQDIQDKDILFAYLSQILGIDKNLLMSRYQQRRKTPFTSVVIAEDVDKKIAMTLEENRFRFPGLYIQETFRRWYPFGNAAAHVVGYVGKIDSEKIKRLKQYGYTPQSIVGYSGVEEFYDRYLMGKEGGLQIEVDSRGRQVRLLGIREPARGQDVQLTIDIRMQEIVLKALDNHPGAGAIIDIDSGEVLALVSSPAFDPNVFNDASKARERARLFVDPAAPMLNRAVRGQYPPGSVFKIVMSVAGLMEKVIHKHTTFFCPGQFNLGKMRFRCTHSHGDQNVVQSLQHSCNVFYYNTGLLLGPDAIYRYAKLFGLGLPTHIDLPSEEVGFVPNSKRRLGRQQSGWYKGDTVNFSIGQGDLLATPLQIARLLAAVALNGKIFDPHLLKAIDGESLVIPSTGKTLALSHDVIQIVQEGLRAAVASSTGTARILNMTGFEIYGKTGTAQSVAGKDSHAWFAGYSMKGTRRIAFCILLEYGGSSANAVRVAKDILEQLRNEKMI